MLSKPFLPRTLEKNLKNGLLRPELFLIYFLISSIAPASSAKSGSKNTSDRPHVIGNWAVQSKLDPITDRRFVTVQTPLDSRTSPFLKINCEDGKPYIIFGIPRMTWKEDESLTVTLRVDKGKVTRSRFTVVGSDGPFAASLSRTTYMKIAKANFIAAYIERADGSNWTLELPVRQTQRAFAPMLEACPIESATPLLPNSVDPSKDDSSPEPSAQEK